MKHRHDYTDGGARSRKLWFAAATSAGIAGLAVLAGTHPTIAPLYETAVGGLLGVLGVYTGGNVGVKHVLTKNVKPEDAPVEGK